MAGLSVIGQSKSDSGAIYSAARPERLHVVPEEYVEPWVIELIRQRFCEVTPSEPAGSERSQKDDCEGVTVETGRRKTPAVRRFYFVEHQDSASDSKSF